MIEFGSSATLIRRHSEQLSGLSLSLSLPLRLPLRAILTGAVARLVVDVEFVVIAVGGIGIRGVGVGFDGGVVEGWRLDLGGYGAAEDGSIAEEAWGQVKGGGGGGGGGSENCVGFGCGFGWIGCDVVAAEEHLLLDELALVAANLLCQPSVLRSGGRKLDCRLLSSCHVNWPSMTHLSAMTAQTRTRSNRGSPAEVSWSSFIRDRWSTYCARALLQDGMMPAEGTSIYLSVVRRRKTRDLKCFLLVPSS